ncbi:MULTISPECIES: 3-methyl-2-oxobutanoate hydroxymethyltransferase [Rhizobium]|uniref:3-methyl-2-oxobutanoate hydroxymethyltransferase n=1 Tax=Rhizobium indicum TaxID=2583231 RepID=A0ABX6PR88_9HYPH|nr:MULTISPECIES: 3-methyl-2-oxobutanoate hydroxymethyltransferase [Rhizobium]NEI65782.1 3-methyl-2-oxobutanoate hydroxymethyltransferase [Rhizobium leguminosarum]NEJ15593.1 3-methyl-2-oxobutanoate hydroxymethyltransferase [Rhizobium ruizarguesonis]NEK29668.1 3-methyl-2-oxobutanoate hydroxymethyltransferase [Rhizobium ruizarguesonis]NKK29725.1 3-methyl-2-oxobutanoate hydroxymethyltransferase [Rhizobium leguminosarum bv. viciae]NKL24296.1 3-methyl-2-oxobutanoate hydroxymethyltransferase [Rhizobi
MNHRRPTVADLLSIRGHRQLSMLRVVTLEEAEAAEKAGIDLVSVPPELLGPAFREVAPTVFAFPGLDDLITAEDYLRAAFEAIRAGGDAVYCAAGMSTVRRLREEGIPVCGHVGLIPSKATWTGGFRAVGKTAASAFEVWRQVKALEEAGAFAAEIEVVPGEVAAAISKRTSLLMLSMGAGTGCDAQYLFAEDVLGQNRGHYPRHAKVYRDFASEFDRLHRERVEAFREYAEDVRSGAYPEKGHLVSIAPEELEGFLRKVESEQPFSANARECRDGTAAN